MAGKLERKEAQERGGRRGCVRWGESVDGKEGNRRKRGLGERMGAAGNVKRRRKQIINGN